MLFEKKMIILSGSTGKGVVLIEKNGLGVKFALRTFGIRGELMAGIVTPERVIIRDLPSSPDPAVVFYVDQIELSNLHFAVFGSELVLYGAIGNRMWPSNLLDILHRHCAKPAVAERVSLAPLKPIADKPKTLPLPDGSGKVQSRLSLYGDDAIASDNFYTGLDIASTVPKIDAFLDGARLLTDVDPPRQPVGFSVGMSEDAANRQGEALDGTVNAAESRAAVEPEVNDMNDEHDIKFDVDRRAEREVDSLDYEVASASSEAYSPAARPDENTFSAPAFEARSDRERIPWWVREAEYLRSLSTREPVTEVLQIKKSAPTSIRKLREVTFFERTKPDIDKLFAGAPRDEEITKLLGGEWVRVDLGGGAVSVGRLDGGVLCYAVPGTYEKVSPLGDNAQWVPKTAESPTGKGYYLIFQNLTTGEIIK